MSSSKVVAFDQKWLYSGKIVVFGQGGCIRAKWLYSGKVVVLFGQNVCIREKKVVFRQKWLYTGKMVVFG